jgi:Fuc2NAc and GlcNAc transferase
MQALVQVLAAGWAVCLGGFPSLNLGVAVVPLGLVGSLLAVIGLAWLINQYNFMDGIDGLAAGQAVGVGLVGGSLLAAAGAAGLSLVALALAAAAGGFLVSNGLWRRSLWGMWEAGCSDPHSACSRWHPNEQVRCL